MSRVWLESMTLDKFLLKKEINTFENYYLQDYRWWYNFSPLVQQRQQLILRLFFDLDLIYRHQISLQEIISKFHNKLGNKHRIFHNYYIGPNNHGIVDIYISTMNELKETMALQVQKNNKNPEEENVGNLFLTDNTAIEYYYSMVLFPEMEKNVLKGIPGIDRIFVETVDILTIVKKEFEHDGRFYWQLDDTKMKRYGINLKHLRSLAGEGNIIIGEIFKSLAGSSIVPISEKNSLIKLQNLIKEAQENYEEKLQEATDKARQEGINLRGDNLQNLINKKYTEFSRPTIVKKSEYVYLQTAGSNLAKILAHPFIDNKLSICDNFHEINDVLGIVACKKEYLKKMQEVVIGGLESNSHPVHILLYTNFVMSRGRPLGSTYSNVSRHPLGFLAEATIERAAAVFRTAAGFGAYESVNSVSTSVSLAERIKVGTGSFDIAYQIKNGDNYLIRYNDNVFTAVKDDMEMPRISSRLIERSEDVEGEANIPDIENSQKISSTAALHRYEIVHPNTEIIMRKESGLLDKEIKIKPLTVPAFPTLLSVEKQKILGYLLPANIFLNFGTPSQEAINYANSKKNELNNAKNLLNFDNKKNIINAYDPFFNRKLGIPFVTNAWFKYWEILHLLKTSLSSFSSVRAFFNAELPGAGLMAFLRFCKQEKMRCSYRASSYLGENTLADTFGIAKSDPSKWLMIDNLLYDGDMMNINNILYLEKLEKFNFYSSDASRGLPVIDNTNQLDYSQEEIFNAKLHLGCALAGFAVLQPGGIFVAKMFTFYEPLSWNLILVYTLLFESFSIFKPQASRTSNSEIYLIGLNYKPNNDIYTWLKQRLINFSMESFLTNDLSVFKDALTIFDRTVERLKAIADTTDEMIPIISQESEKIFSQWLKTYPLTFKGVL
jgi:hypothetical protein